MTKPTIIAWLKPTCGWSNGVRAVMKKYDLPFDDRDIINNPNHRQEMIEKSGQMLSPCVEINGRMLADLIQDRLGPNRTGFPTTLFGLKKDFSPFLGGLGQPVVQLADGVDDEGDGGDGATVGQVDGPHSCIPGLVKAGFNGNDAAHGDRAFVL